MPKTFAATQKVIWRRGQTMPRLLIERSGRRSRPPAIFVVRENSAKYTKQKRKPTRIRNVQSPVDDTLFTGMGGVSTRMGGS